MSGTRIAGVARVTTRFNLAALFSILWLGCNAPSEDLPDSGARTDASTQNDAGTQNDGGTQNDAGSDPGICPAGTTLVQYSMTPVNPVPDVSAIQLPGLLGATDVRNAGSGLDFSVRFDLCDDGSARTLHAILYRGNSYETPGYYVRDESISTPAMNTLELDEGLVVEFRIPASSWVIEGLDAALGGDLAPLRIRVMYEYGLLLMGHSTFIALAQGNVGPSSIQYNSVYVVVGGLAPGNVFDSLVCDFGEELLDETFVMGTATFEVGGCSFLGGGETLGYRITSLAVQDTSTELTEAERARFEFPTEADVARVLTYQWNHHNACDSFHLALDHADYAASTSPAAGCGTTVPEAPPRSFDENPIRPVQFRIRYHGGDWVDGEMTGCFHYLFCN